MDRLGRPLGSLRLSVTDRCNLRCRYCMPERDYVWLPRESILTFEELTRIARVFASLGAGKVRLTGGEPLLRQGIEELVAQLADTRDVREIALTTNGLLLARHAASLRDAGLDRLTVSLDTLRADRMLAFARSAHHADVLAGIDAADDAGFSGTKLNTVVIRGYNDDEVLDIIEFARPRRLEPRFIEYMDVGGATGWEM
jgi:GTP 3',8-cyclase